MNKTKVIFEKEFEVTIGEADTFIPFCEYVYTSLIENYEKPFGSPKPRIGF